MRTYGVAGLAVLMVGCGHRVEVSYVESAGVDLGQDVRQVLVVDRVGPGNAGETLLDAAESVLTGEGLDGDQDTRQAAMDGLAEVLRQTDRYQVEIATNDPKVDDVMFGGAMDPREVVRLCKKHGCDAVVSLDALDSDSTVAVQATRDATGRQVDATTATTVSATFRAYDAAGSLLDQQTTRSRADDQASADTRAVAVAGLPDPGDTQRDLAWEAGELYGQRIAPHEVFDSRPLYGTGCPELRDAMDHVKAGDWKGAEVLWKKVVAHGSEKDAAKARYDLAVGKEVEGSLDRALALARHAAVVLHRGRTRGYVEDLEIRLADADRVDQQLADTEG